MRSSILIRKLFFFFLFLKFDSDGGLFVFFLFDIVPSDGRFSKLCCDPPAMLVMAPEFEFDELGTFSCPDPLWMLLGSSCT